MAKTKTRPYDAAGYLETTEDMAAYLEAALEDGEPAVVVQALGTIARARGMSRIARDTVWGARASIRRFRPKATRSSPLY
ncbi:MAG: addiction module antidote protein [Syntrophobacteraceae bacterium]